MITSTWTRAGAAALAALLAAGAWAQDEAARPDGDAGSAGYEAPAATGAVAQATPAGSDTTAVRRASRGGTMRPLGPHLGEMIVEMDMPEGAGAGADAGEAAPEDQVVETLRFEPWQMLDEMFLRDDVVYVMRHGPTDWSRLDEKDVAPTDCARQRVMSPEGRERMVQMGRLLAANDVLPGAIVVSEWCRNQQTLDALLAGFDAVDPAIREAIPVETDPGLNLLLALQGAESVEPLRARIEGWDGAPDGRRGPLLIITHFTNIEELTTFTVYEGEILVVDPDRSGRVLGYLRLASAAPDVGHFEAEEEPGADG